MEVEQDLRFGKGGNPLNPHHYLLKMFKEIIDTFPTLASSTLKNSPVAFTNFPLMNPSFTTILRLCATSKIRNPLTTAINE